MPTPHYNYYPPSGAVIDQNEPKAYWNGRAWQKDKRTYAVPSGHSLIGRSGGPLSGWYYDWSKRAWMEPDKAAPPAAAPVVQSPRRDLMRPVVVRPPQPAPLAIRPKENSMSKCDHGRKPSLADQVMEVVKVASYIAGPIVIGVGASLKAPAAPPVTAVQPEWLINENQNRFAANTSAYQSRKEAWNNVGQALLTFGSSGLSKGDKDEIGKIVESAMKKAG